MNPLQIRLAALRRRLRLVISFRGLSWLVTLSLATIVVAGWLDWRFHLPGWQRALLLVAGLSGAGSVSYRLLVRPLLARADDLTLALRVEALYPGLKDGLASAVQFLEQPGDADRLGSASLRQEAVRLALRQAQRCNFYQLVNTRGLGLTGGLLALATALALVLVFLSPTVAWTALMRLGNPFGSHGWPLATHLEVRAPERIARGEPLVIRGDLRGVIPAEATVVFRVDGTPPTEHGCEVARGEAPDRGTLLVQLDTKRVQRRISFQVRANDARTDWREVLVAPAPELALLDGKPSPQVQLSYPTYTDLGRLELAAGSGDVEAVAGTRVALRAAANRRLARAWLEFLPESPLVTPAAYLGPLGSRDAAGAVALLACGQAVWEPVPARFDATGQAFRIDFLPRVTGQYALHLEDESGLRSSRVFRLHVMNDPAPKVSLERPSRSRDSLEVLPDAEITLQVLAEDQPEERLFGLRSVYLEYWRKNEGDQPRRLILYQHSAWSPVAVQVPVALAAVPLPVPGLALQVKPQRLQPSQRWSLRELGLNLQPGDTLTLRACADDFDDVAVNKQPGRSQEVELHIIGPAALDALVHEAQARVHQELVRLHKHQQEALDKVIGPLNQWEQTGRLQPEEVDQLLQADQLQQQIRARVGTPEEGLQADVARILQTLRDNRRPRSTAHDRMATVAAELDRLAREELKQIEEQLTKARKEEETASEPRRPPGKNQSALSQARRHQQEVENTLKELLSRLEPYASTFEIKGEARSLLQEQGKLNDETQRLLRQSLRGRDPDRLTPEQRARLEELKQAMSRDGRLTREQERLLDELKQLLREAGGDGLTPGQQAAFDQLQQRLRKGDANRLTPDQQAAVDSLKKELKAPQADGLRADRKEAPAHPEETRAQTDKAAELQRRLAARTTDLLNKMAQVAQARKDQNDPETARTLEEAAELGQKEEVAEQLRAAAEDLAAEKLGQAGAKQQAGTRALEQMVQTLEAEGREADLDRLIKKLKEVEQQLADLSERQDQLRKKAQEAQRQTEPSERQQELQRLARQQDQLRKEAQDLARQLSRLRAEQASRALSRAGGRMEQAGREMDSGENAEGNQEEALDRLEDAQQLVEQARREAEDELAREKLAKIADEIQQLKGRQDAQHAEAARIHKAVLERTKWDRGLEDSLAQLARAQEGLSQEAASLAKGKLAGALVFARILRKAAEAMGQASEQMNHRREGIDPLYPRLDALALEEENSADSQTQQWQRQAGRYLDQLLNALKPEEGRNEPPPPQGDGEPSEGARSGRGEDGIPAVAQLKALRALQEEVNRRTAEFARQHPDPAQFTDKENAELQALRVEQQEVAELLEELTTPPEKEGPTTGDEGSKIGPPAGFELRAFLLDPPVPPDESASDQPLPPVRLKKKGQPDPEALPAKKPLLPPEEDEVKKDAEPDPPEAERNEQEILDRITKNMRASEDRLRGKDAGEGTRQIQQDILTDLDSLIEENRRQQQQQQSNSNSRSSRAGGATARERRDQQARGSGQQERQRQLGSGQRNRPETQPQQAATNDGLGGGRTTRDDVSKIADLYKDVWGHLPEALRQEMDAYSREHFMAKYNDLLKRYYSTLAERGQRK